MRTLNLFSRFSEKQLLTTGIVCMLAGAWILSFTQCSFDAVLHMTVLNKSFAALLAETMVIILLLFLFLFLAAKIFNNKTRLVDVLNTAMISRIPLFLLALYNLNGSLSEQVATIASGKLPQPDASMFIFSFTSILLVLASIVILLQGFKVAANAKKPLHYVWFAIAVVLADIASRFILPYVNF